MLIAVRAFVFMAFLAIGASFVATSAMLIYEFRDAGWLSLATFYSHLFLFFPTFGVVALCAFFTPACAFFDLYWRHMWLGRLRAVFGISVVIMASWYAAELLRSSHQRSVFELAPGTLAADRGEPEGCGETQNPCSRMPVFAALEDVRRVSQSRIGLSDLIRDCNPDPLVEPAASGQKKFCFAMNRLSDGAQLIADAECCQAQARLVEAVAAMHAVPERQSMTGRLHALLLPLKVLFFLTLVLISALLAVHREKLVTYYPRYIDAIERGVLIGAFAMLFYPVMNHAYLQSASLLFGAATGSTYRTTGPYISFGFGVWALAILFFFYRRRDKNLESLGRIAGLLGSAIAILKYNIIIDVIVRIAGSGASLGSVVVLSGAALLALVLLFLKITNELAAPALAGGLMGKESVRLPERSAPAPAAAPAASMIDPSGSAPVASGEPIEDRGSEWGMPLPDSAKPGT